jgi:hypothetical protein
MSPFLSSNSFVAFKPLSWNFFHSQFMEDYNHSQLESHFFFLIPVFFEFLGSKVGQINVTYNKAIRDDH